MKYNIKYNAENTAALTLVLQVYTVLSDLMNSNYIEIPFLLFMVRNLPLPGICLCNTLHLGDRRRLTALPFNSLSVPRAEQWLISHCKRQFYGNRVTPSLVVTYHLPQVLSYNIKSKKIQQQSFHFPLFSHTENNILVDM